MPTKSKKELSLVDMWTKYTGSKGKAQGKIGDIIGDMLLEENDICYHVYDEDECRKRNLVCSWIPPRWFRKGQCSGKFSLSKKPMHKLTIADIHELCFRYEELEEIRQSVARPLEKQREMQLLYLRAVRRRVEMFAHEFTATITAFEALRFRLDALQRSQLCGEARVREEHKIRKALRKAQSRWSVLSAMKWSTLILFVGGIAALAAGDGKTVPVMLQQLNNETILQTLQTCNNTGGIWSRFKPLTGLKNLFSMGARIAIADVLGLDPTQMAEGFTSSMETAKQTSKNVMQIAYLIQNHFILGFLPMLYHMYHYLRVR